MYIKALFVELNIKAVNRETLDAEVKQIKSSIKFDSINKYLFRFRLYVYFYDNFISLEIKQKTLACPRKLSHKTLASPRK